MVSEPISLTAENFAALSKLEDIEHFEHAYQLFVEAAENLPGDTVHSEDKRLDNSQPDEIVELFNQHNAGDLGVEEWKTKSLSDLIKLLGMLYCSFLFTLTH